MKDFTPILRFIASSDIHYTTDSPTNQKYFERGLELAYAYAQSQEYKKIDALYVVGDFANGGTEEQMQAVAGTLKNCLKPETVPTLTMASHEYMCEGGEQTARERFSRIFGMETNRHKVINGFHFISVTTTRGCHFEEKEREFIARELKKAADDSPFKPIFFFQHPHIQGTVYGSICWGEDEITDILMNYPQIIDFSGHSHAPLNDPRSIHQQHFTSVGTGCSFYLELDEFDKIYGTVPPQDRAACQFLIVEADAQGRVLIKPYDVITEQFFPNEWFVEKPWEPDSFVYTDARRYNAPKIHFEPSAKLTAAVNGDKVDFTFDQATAESEYVNDYKITVRRAGDGAVIKQACIWSCYYYSDMPKTLTQTLEGFDKGEYTVKIVARGFWDNYSDNCLSADFAVE